MSTVNISEIHRLLEEVRKRLVSITRNRLIHVNRESKRSNSVNIINERSDDIFEILCKNGKRMSLLGTKKEQEGDVDPGDTFLASFRAIEEDFDESRYKDMNLETPLTPSELQRRLLSMARTARTLEQEQGINTLFLAMGFLEWYEDEASAVKREAPLILIPVELVRDFRSGRYVLKFRKDDVVSNLALRTRLHEEFGILLPELQDKDVADIRPSDYFKDVKAAYTKPRWELDKDGMQLGFFSHSKLQMYQDLDPKNWPEDILGKDSLLGRLLTGNMESEPDLFSPDQNLDEVREPKDFLHVVDADASQTRVIEEVRAGRNLVVQGPPGTGKSQTITNILAAAVADGKKVLFVAEKMAALEVVHRRMKKAGLEALCLELHSKKTNKKLFWQELKDTWGNGPGPPPANVDASDLKKARDELNDVARALHKPLEGLDYTPFEVIAVLVRMVGREIPPPETKIWGAELELETFSSEKVEKYVQAVKSFCKTLEKLKEPGTVDSIPPSSWVRDHPFSWVQNYKLQPTDQQRLKQVLQQASARLEKLLDHASQLTETLPKWQNNSFARVGGLLGLILNRGKAPVQIRDYATVLFRHWNKTELRSSLEVAETWIGAKARLGETFNDVAWVADISSIHSIRCRVAEGVESLLKRVFGDYRAASRELRELLKERPPKKPEERLKLVDELIDALEKREAYLKVKSFLGSELKAVWHGDCTEFATLLAGLDWLKKVMTSLPALTLGQLQACLDLPDNAKRSAKKALGLCNETKDEVSRLFRDLKIQAPGKISFDQVDLALLRERLDLMRHSEHYPEWAEFGLAGDEMPALGLAKLASFLMDGKIPLENAVDEFEYALAERRWNHAHGQRPELARIANMNRTELVERFQELDRERMSLVQSYIQSKHLNGLPQSTDRSMMRIQVEARADKKRGHMSIRDGMQHVGNTIQRIKPIFLMSPSSVTQFLSRGEGIDLLVIDEASQVRPEEALGSVARTKQIVVIGDQKQLPPTSFFDRQIGDDESGSADEDPGDIGRPIEMESILSLCEVMGLKSIMLEWHYRSKHPSLIQVSNKEFYSNRLKLPPSPFQNHPDLGLKFKRVPGVYSRGNRGAGRKGTNQIEAEAIAQRIEEHAEKRYDQSLGVVAFSKVQADMITEILDLKRRDNPTLDVFLREGNQEEVFVKNIENVQGDERDVILISVGYGPGEGGGHLASQNFGPVNQDGGERRLNVIFTRARYLCEVFCSFDPGEIDAKRAAHKGPGILKKFLEFAESGILGPTSCPTGRGPDSRFEEDVADEIIKLGFEVDYQVGVAGFRIDLGVRDPDRPDRYILGVECDGRRYHSSLSARERDRHRQEILEGLGWEIHRIWSTDWYTNRRREIKRLRDALQKAKDRAGTGPKFIDANEESNRALDESDDDVDSNADRIDE